jgi:heme/copper-type cytochrome/quinol oxidase subunit 2
MWTADQVDFLSSRQGRRRWNISTCCFLVWVFFIIIIIIIILVCVCVCLFSLSPSREKKRPQGGGWTT